jgi:hypothetical protein
MGSLVRAQAGEPVMAKAARNCSLFLFLFANNLHAQTPHFGEKEHNMYSPAFLEKGQNPVSSFSISWQNLIDPH